MNFASLFIDASRLKFDSVSEGTKLFSVTLNWFLGILKQSYLIRGDFLDLPTIPAINPAMKSNGSRFSINVIVFGKKRVYSII